MRSEYVKMIVGVDPANTNLPPNEVERVVVSTLIGLLTLHGDLVVIYRLPNIIAIQTVGSGKVWHFVRNGLVEYDLDLLYSQKTKISLCKYGSSCKQGCGCGCAKDLGFIEPEDEEEQPEDPSHCIRRS